MNLILFPMPFNCRKIDNNNNNNNKKKKKKKKKTMKKYDSDKCP